MAERLEHGSRNTEIVGSSPGPGGFRLLDSLSKKLYSTCSVVGQSRKAVGPLYE